MRRRGTAIVLAMTFAAAAAAPAAAGISVGIGVAAVPGVWVGTGWTWLPNPPPAPEVAVVRIKVKPWWTRVVLDGRFIGIADDFDGVPDYLYLRPGTYRLEFQLGGYRTEVAEIVAKAGYRYDVVLKLKRIKGTPKEHFWERPPRPKPLPRLYGPAAGGEGAAPAASAPPAGAGRQPGGGTGPDLTLRPDLAPRPSGPTAGGAAEPSPRSAGARLAIRVEPPEAAVYLDGEFLATGRELRQLAEPIAVGPGHHRIEAVLPGGVSAVREIDVAKGETATVELSVGAGGSGGGQRSTPDL